MHGIEETGMIAVILARLTGGKAIFEKHSDPFSYKKGFLKNCLLSVYAWVEKLTVRWTDGVIGTGPGLVQQVNDMGTATPAFHIFDIPSSLVEPEQSNVDRVRKELVQQDNELLITFVGSFAVYQGVDLLLASIPLVVRENGDARFIIIGGTEEEINERKENLQKDGVADSVTFLGKIAPDLLPDYLAASDILLSPRTSGVNTPLKLLDYLKIGRPIVATDVVANRLILDDSTSVLTPAEPSAMAKGIASLLDDPMRREKMGKKGRQLHEKKYNFKEYTKRLGDCYEQVLGE